MSGGKDSCYSLMECVRHGHEIVAIANLHPPLEYNTDELDSYMFQTVGYDGVGAIATALNVPLFKRPLHGKSVKTELLYTGDDATSAAGGDKRERGDSGEEGEQSVSEERDEVEDLYELLKLVKQEVPQVEAVSSGAILSTYQRDRVEHVCEKLRLVSLAYLWQREQKELLNEMLESGLDAILSKVTHNCSTSIHF